MGTCVRWNIDRGFKNSKNQLTWGSYLIEKHLVHGELLDWKGLSNARKNLGEYEGSFFCSIWLHLKGMI